jgi:HDOD domain
MSATVLGLDIILQEPYIDLRLVSDLILSDVGATIQILRLIGREYDFAADRPRRIGDCIASLDVSAWYAAISARTFPCDREHAETTALWRHCRLVAQYAQLVAESMEQFAPEDAYLVGLLHGIASIPTVMGWPAGDQAGKTAGALLEMEDALPSFVHAALQTMDELGPLSGWRFILAAAHELAASARGSADSWQEI